jgi:hypothetical protein
MNSLLKSLIPAIKLKEKYYRRNWIVKSYDGTNGGFENHASIQTRKYFWHWITQHNRNLLVMSQESSSFFWTNKEKIIRKNS